MSKNRTPLALLAGALAVAGLTPAGAVEAMQRKPGLWRVDSWLDGAMAPGPTLVCVGQTGDDLLRESLPPQPGCPPLEVRAEDHTVKAHAVCTQKGMTTTTDATVIGDLASRYHGDLAVRYDPPRNGIAAMHLTQEARWVGPCPPDLAPGQSRRQGEAADAMLQAMKRQHEPR